MGVNLVAHERAQDSAGPGRIRAAFRDVPEWPHHHGVVHTPCMLLACGCCEGVRGGRLFMFSLRPRGGCLRHFFERYATVTRPSCDRYATVTFACKGGGRDKVIEQCQQLTVLILNRQLVPVLNR